MGLFVGNFCFYIRLSLLELCGSERLAAALIEAAEHLVELQTQALNAREQTLKGDDDNIAYDDNGDVAAVPPRVNTTIFMLAWTITNAPTRRKDTVLLK